MSFHRESGVVDTINTDTTDEVLAGCRTVGAYHRVGFGTGAFWDRYRTIPVDGFVTLDAPGAITLECEELGASAPSYTLTATEVLPIPA